MFFKFIVKNRFSAGILCETSTLYRSQMCVQNCVDVNSNRNSCSRPVSHKHSPSITKICIKPKKLSITHLEVHTPYTEPTPFAGGRNMPTTTAWSRSYGSNVICSWGFSLSACNFLTSAAKTASGWAVESIQDALMEMTKWPPFFRKYCEFSDTIRAWSGWATSAKTVSTIPTSIRYLCGWRASSMIGMMLVRFLATLIRSRPDRLENSTAYTSPSGPTTSETCDTVVPEAAPRYNTFEPGGMYMLSIPPRIAAANFDRKGFHTRYSIFSPFVWKYSEGRLKQC